MLRLLGPAARGRFLATRHGAHEATQRREGCTELQTSLGRSDFQSVLWTPSFAVTVFSKALPRRRSAKSEARGMKSEAASWQRPRSRLWSESSGLSDIDLEACMQHLLVACSLFLLSLLVEQVAIEVLLGFVGEFAIVCSSCGGDPERSPKRGPNSELTAAGCATTDGLGIDVVKLRSPWVFSEPVAVQSPTRRPNVLSWTGGVEVSSGTGDHSIGRAAGRPENLPIKWAMRDFARCFVANVSAF